MKKNLLETNRDLYWKFLGLQQEATNISLLVNRIGEFKNLNHEAILIMLENFEDLYSLYARSIQNDAVLSLCRMLDKKENGYGLLNLHNRLISHVNKLKKKNIPLYQQYTHVNLINELQQLIDNSMKSSQRLRDRRDNYLAHNSNKKIQFYGVNQNPTIDSVKDVMEKYNPPISLSEFKTCSDGILKYFEVCNYAFLDSQYMIREFISRGDLRELLFSLKKLRVWEELHSNDYEKKFEVFNLTKDWRPFDK